VGNRLPDPATLFLIGTLVVMFASFLASRLDLAVQHVALVREGAETAAQGGAVVSWEPVFEADGAPRTTTPRDLLSRDGIFWLLSSMVKNFTGFAPLGVVLVGMLGIGLAERVGLMGALLKVCMRFVPAHLLAPTVIFVGIMSSMGLDAGFVVLPPLAAALFCAAGRSPLAGIAAVIAGVSAGFNANLFVTGLDPVLAAFTMKGAQVLDPEYAVSPACNWWFMIASTFVMTLLGWWTTVALVEKRLAGVAPEHGGPAARPDTTLESDALAPAEARALRSTLLVMGGIVGLTLSAIFVPGAPLYGAGLQFDRWVEAIVPLLFLTFAIPSVVYGVSIGRIATDKDAARMLVETIASMAPVIVLAFFAAQFIEAFKHSRLDQMLALWGGQQLGELAMPRELLIVAFIGVAMAFNLMMASMSAKYAMLAPIFVPMFMMVGISPELTQAAYRIGDSVTNVITPLNPYLVIVLVFVKQYVPRAGMGTLIATLLPYALVFAIAWPLLLLGWMALGLPLGPDGGLVYTP